MRVTQVILIQYYNRMSNVRYPGGVAGTLTYEYALT